MKPVPLELIQAAADALLRFPDLPNDVREQFEGYINGNWAKKSKSAIKHLRFAGGTMCKYPWIYLTSLGPSPSVTYWVLRYNFYASNL
jgi:hypothetical protein